VAPGLTIAAAFARRQSWTWLTSGTFDEVAPRSRTFSYVASFSLVDVFGNAYTGIVTGPLLVPVSVSSAKTFDHDAASVLITFGLVYLVLSAVVADAGGPYGWIGGAIIAAIGMACLIAATFKNYSAIDPPVPNFESRVHLFADPRAWRIPEPDDERFHALHSLASLLVRAVSAAIAVIDHRDRAWAAFVDRDESARVARRDAARHELETLRRLASATADAADESSELLTEIARESLSVPGRDRLRALARRFADELGLSAKEFAIVIGALQDADDERLQTSLERVRAEGTRTLAYVVRRLYEAAVGELEEREYLR
jgi:hypothetical protein